MANFNLNKAILGGRLTNKPELKTTPSGISVCTFGIAVDRRYSGKDSERQTDFINVVAWRQTAEFISKYFDKGSSICIVGSIQTRSYEKDGQKRTVYEVVAEEASFVDSKAEADNQRYGDTSNAPAASAQAYVPDAYENFDDEETGLPF